MNKQLLNINIFGTPIIIDTSGLLFPLTAFIVGAVVSGGTHLTRLRRGLFTVIAYTMTMGTHVVGHVISSRQVEAPMSEARLALPRPQTLYHDDNVSAKAHRGRAIGGPIANISVFGGSLLLRPLTQSGTLSREFLNSNTILHGLIGFGSLLPIPFFDGGSILKWTFVQRGRTPDAAEAVVEEINLTLGLLALIGSVILAVFRVWRLAALAALQGIIFIGAGLGRIK